MHIIFCCRQQSFTCTSADLLSLRPTQLSVLSGTVNNLRFESWRICLWGSKLCS